MRRVLERATRYGIKYRLAAAGAAAVIGVAVCQGNRQTPAHATEFTSCVKWDSNWDRRDPSSLQKPEERRLVPKATRHLLLIRHGQYHDDGKGDKERILTQLGREQADYTGRRLAELNFPYSRLVSSTKPRAKETADIIHKHLPGLELEQTDLLKEGPPVAPEPPSDTYKPEPYEFFQEGARIEAAFRQYFHRADVDQTEDSFDVIVCHGNVIRYCTCRALQFPREAWLRMGVDHASITWIFIRPSGHVGIRVLGESGHIPVDKLSSA